MDSPCIEALFAEASRRTGFRRVNDESLVKGLIANNSVVVLVLLCQLAYIAEDALGGPIASNSAAGSSYYLLCQRYGSVDIHKEEIILI